MFDFEKLIVYQKARDFATGATLFLMEKDVDKVARDQLKRAALSIMLNTAESTSRFSKKDRRNFLVIARGSAIECVAAYDFLKTIHQVTDDYYSKQYKTLEEISKMLFSMIRNLD
ncbi:MAG: four helix bundle protein [Bacteroidota bacterium]